MKANELRLNNLVYAFKTVWAIDNSDFSNLDKIETYEFIPLTEEWLLKAGFYKHIKFKNTYVKGSFSIKITDRGVIYFKYNDFVIAELLFIHQLQNLFFSLCGEELVFSTEP